MNRPATSKGKSPFYPGQPVPVELFAGRQEEINHIVERGIRQVRLGKPVAVFVQGEYGIGKSSIAGFLQWHAERRHGLHSIYAPLGSAETLADVGACILEATLRSGALEPTRSQKIKDWLSKYVGEQSLFGFTVHTEALKKDAPSVAKGLLPFLSEALAHLRETDAKGIFLVLDEINGISTNKKFAHFVKGIVDTNAMSNTPLPLLLMLCGVEERRRDMIRHYQPIDRIFDVIDIEPMSNSEMRGFFEKAFRQAGIRADKTAIKTMAFYSAGFPKIMHLVGDAAYWLDQDGILTEDEAVQAVITAADEVGKKYVDQQVYKALRSKDYHAILNRVAEGGPAMSFHKKDVAKGLTESQKKKLNNFLQKMKKLNVIRSGDVRGEYTFNVRMVWLYIWLNSLRKEGATKRQ